MADSRRLFSLLHPGIQKWVASKGWNDFHDIQARSIEYLLGTSEGNIPPNLVISAATASGKTEAALMPALTLVQNYIDEHRDASRFCQMLVVSPLKALLSDTYRRMLEMTKDLSVPVYLWHGDANQSAKKQMLKEHDGIMLITPESLEAFLTIRGEWCSNYMTPLIIIVDEFHTFLDGSRGKQALSLLDRIDFINAQHSKSPAIRIALSATLSKLDVVASILSPRSPFEVIDGTSAGTDEMDIEVNVYAPPVKREGQSFVPKEDNIAIASEIIEKSVGEKTLSFAESRMQVENIASTINDLCKKNNIASEAFPHHGSLAKEVRESLEHRLVSTDKPTMAVATLTLELGIDIGDIYKVFQIGTTNSVASLRQRIGRSGRRDGKKKVECLVTSSRHPDNMEEDLLVTISEIELMNAGWFEPPENKRKDISVLVSEILSVLKQYGSAYENELYEILCVRGAFHNIDEALFSMVVGDMERADFLYRTSEGYYLPGPAGERELEDWKFFATFMSDESFTVKQGQKKIGEIMPSSTSLMLLAQGGTFMLGGRYWKVQSLDMKSKVINAKQTTTKAKFLVPTSRGCGGVCGTIKKTMIKLLCGDLKGYEPYYLNEYGLLKLAEAREYAQQHHLNGLGISIYDAGEKGSETDSEVKERISHGYGEQALLRVSPPVNQATQDAIEKILMATGMEALGLNNIPMWRLSELVDAVIGNWEHIKMNKENLFDKTMLEDIRNSEKYNYLFSDETLQYAYVDEKLDLEGAKKWFDAYRRFVEAVK